MTGVMSTFCLFLLFFFKLAEVMPFPLHLPSPGLQARMELLREGKIGDSPAPVLQKVFDEFIQLLLFGWLRFFWELLLILIATSLLLIP